jgi:hypothetical protein
MCLRLSSREKKKNRNSPSRKTVGDKQAPPLASQHSLASPSEKGKSSCSRSDPFRPRTMRIRLSASFQYLAQPHLRSSSVGRLASGGCRLERALICRAGILSTPHKRKYTVKSTLYGRVRYPLCGGCRCRPKRQMGSRQLAPKGMRRIRSEGLDGSLVGILYGSGIIGGSFPFLYRKSAGLATPNGPRLRTCV